MLRGVAHFISVIFHPLFMVPYVLGILLLINPYLFSIQDSKSKGLILISVFLLSVFFPLFGILMLRLVGLNQSVMMSKREERIAPLIITGIFYLWLFVNIKSNPGIPEAFIAFSLGATIAVFVSFFINNFSKISLHAVGAGGFLAAILMIRVLFSYDSFILRLGGLGQYLIHVDLVIMLGILIAGLVGTARLILKAHNQQDLYGGFIVGVIAQIIAFNIIL